MMLKTLFLAALLPTAAQFGRKKEVNAAGSLGDLGEAAGHSSGLSDVDLAMAGWEQLGNNPEKMQELMAGFKDPDVWAKAEEMLKDPQYMAAAKAKLAEIQAKAQANGLLDEYGQPIPGAAAASAGGMAGIMNAMKSMHGGDAAGTAGAQAREWELEAIERHKAGELNAAELGMANLKNAMKDPSVLREVSQMMQDPENMAALKKMMADPSFQQQARRVAEQMKASGDLPDFASPEMQQRMQQAMRDPNLMAKV
ncbi:chloroplast light harvesting protein isoform 12, partial [Chrysochromulina tobinii]